MLPRLPRFIADFAASSAAATPMPPSLLFSPFHIRYSFSSLPLFSHD
jgi:hypothetical protein